jgi:hypothetical protein
MYEGLICILQSVEACEQGSGQGRVAGAVSTLRTGCWVSDYSLVCDSQFDNIFPSAHVFSQRQMQRSSPGLKVR